MTIKEYLQLTNKNEMIDSVGLYYDNEAHRNGLTTSKDETIDSHLTMTSILKYLDLEVTDVNLQIVSRGNNVDKIRANIYVKRQ